MIRIALMLVIAAFSSGAALARDYAVGQVWEYKTRAGDTGSLLKIQQIDEASASGGLGTVYHISVIGFHFINPRMAPELPHSPVTKEVLDASVTRLSASKAQFPDARPGIATWREDKGGVFTISVAEIVGIIDKQTEHVGE